MRKLYILVFLILIGINNGHAINVEVQGDITVDSTWSSNIDTIKVVGDIYIDSLATLTIEAGVIVDFQDYYFINIEGNVMALGNENDKIVFTVSDTAGYSENNHTGWSGIDFEVTDIDADSTIFEFCEFYYGKGNSSKIKKVENGGAIFANNASKLRFSNCSFKYNYTDGNGGAIHTKKSVIVIENCLFQENFSNGYGGALNIAGSGENESKLRFTNCVVNKNRSDERGGGMKVVCGRNHYIANNVFTNNKSDRYGGGILLSGETIDQTLLTDNFFANNSAENGGGIRTSGYCTPILANNIVVNNSAEYYGGGIHMGYESAPFIKNCVIANNFGEYGSGLAVGCSYDSNIVLKNSIIFGNYMAEDTTQVYFDELRPAEEATIYITNCLLDGDTAQVTADVNEKEYLICTNNINCDPEFVNPTTGIGAGFESNPEDWKLAVGSHCIDSGVVSVDPFYQPEFDYFGSSRNIGGHVDIGVYEYELVRSIEIQSDSDVITSDNGTMQLSAVVLPTDAEDISVTWSVSNGTDVAEVDSNGLVTALIDGEVTIQAVTNDGSELSDDITLTISNQVSSLGKVNDSFEFSIYPNPVHNIMQISLPETISSAHFVLYSVTGRVVLENDINANKTSVNISNIANGMYMLKVTSGENTSIKRILKK